MKAFTTVRPNSGANTTAARLYTALSALVESNELEGAAPKETQVTDFVKNWRRDNPRNSMASVIELCDGRLYEQLDFSTMSNRGMIILCDSQPDGRPGAAGSVSHLGDGSAAYPFRVGITCLNLNEII
ncbi:unnamed protein product [Phytophthora fragariaefolia]|uniref:Unnamed protein product n=1 Tax=Phytophthora fragariaefolia TaxID=1490495 RepID=A0A9W6TLJ1_9STRA|nr:unnamed protein product [Phytophthora fragariaefolia]